MRLISLWLSWAVILTVSHQALAKSSEEFCMEQLSAPQSWAREYPQLDEMYRKALHLVRDSSHPTLTLVVPAYKEEARIGASIHQIREFFDRYPYPVEVLVRIEKSPDRTVEVAREAAGDDPRIQISAHEVQRGKGYAVRQGMLAANGDYVVFTDTDLSTPLPEIFRFLSLIADGNTSDILIGDRRHPESRIDAKQTFARQVMGASFQALIRAVLSSSGLHGVHDTQCGFKMFTRRASQALFNLAHVEGFAFDIEVLMIATELRMGISAIPITWKDDPRSTVRPLLDPMKMAWDVVKMRAKVQNEMKNSIRPKQTLVRP